VWFSERLPAYHHRGRPLDRGDDLLRAKSEAPQPQPLGLRPGQPEQRRLPPRQLRPNGRHCRPDPSGRARELSPHATWGMPHPHHSDPQDAPPTTSSSLLTRSPPHPNPNPGSNPPPRGIACQTIIPPHITPTAITAHDRTQFILHLHRIASTWISSSPDAWQFPGRWCQPHHMRNSQIRPSRHFQYLMSSSKALCVGNADTPAVNSMHCSDLPNGQLLDWTH
jgi:hypothetical protein